MGKQARGPMGSTNEETAALDLFATGYAAETHGMSWELGQWLTPRYRIEGKLGEGGMGVVLCCWDEWRQAKVAIKLLHTSPHGMGTETSSTQAQLLRELGAQERCQHEGIVRTFDVGCVEGTEAWFLTMELVEGTDIATLLAEGRVAGALPLLSWESWSPWMGQLVAVLTCAHEKGVIHRDLKPSNLMLTPEGNIKLLDFGIAALATENTATSGLGVAGTAYYMAPEQLEAGAVMTPATDVYALGAMVYEILTGKLVSGRIEGPHALLAHQGIAAPFAASVDAVVLQALAQRPEARYPSAAAFWDALESAMADAPAPEAVSATQRPTSKYRTSKTAELVDTEDANSDAWTLETAKGSYHFDEILTEGDYTTLWSGIAIEGPEKGQAVVAKIVDELEDNDLLQDERRALQLLCSNKAKQQKHLPKSLDQFTTAEGQLGLVLERFDGYDLDAVIDAYPDGVPAHHIFWIMRRALSALGHAHSLGILHGNIEPTHIMLRPADHNVMLLDWGYAIVNPAQSGQGFKCANEIFSPPEVWAQKPPLPASDIYALGMTMIALLGGARSDDLDADGIPEETPAPLVRLLRCMTLKSALQRPRDAWQLYHQLNKMRKAHYGPHKFIEFVMPDAP